MFGRKIAAGLLALLLGAGLAGCGNDDNATTGDKGPGQSSKEDPTLDNPNGGGTSDAGSDGADEGNPANGATDSGSGTGSGRSDG